MLPDEWKKKSFGDVVNIANGLIDPREISFKDIKHIGPENVISNTGRIVNEKTCGDLKLISGKYEFDANSIVYSKIRPNLNKVCTPSYSGVCSADMYVLHPRKGIDKNFLFFSILGNSFKNRAISMSMRTGMPKINREDLSSIPILLPPLPEQKKIAAILSTWDRAIEGTEKLLANSQQQKKALMQQLLTGKKRLPGFTGEWQVHRLGEIADFLKGKGLSKADINPKGKTPCIHYGSLFTEQPSTITETKTLTNTFEGAVFSKKNDVLMPTSDVTPAGLAVASAIQKDNVLLGNDILIIRPNYEQLYGPFLSRIIRNSKKKILSFATGTTVFHLYASDMKGFQLLVPPLPEQKAIATVLTTADEEITAIESALSRLRQEKKALMQQLLTGKRRVKVD
ncbi:restriction endonuclease subunit S [Acetobacter ascendens]|uniref:Type I site-specific deoxyribonuclease n=1 Tax=Acetobacter ascendens TaxID=481146 RepID=A0A1Y0V024_9PROT|nr:restriction endonuclease subunit S [Acetobacter ascendens]ARW11490.1 Type I site-specific deoxyribonuclease [Acetobacter ascendens]